ncbi:LOW QUALITY PROTEIN: glypican-6 [Drosophila ficusphila]|uniref:LOW QUALITY PROTEIN: glypican-6 n=1 Tax=Drosophila ficusphila TaxID=30025 RepID=UPI001C89036B|nr:LOW QUALITY PROTEIN: glypican-6 [Drosophila ficusphila]
MQHQQQQLLHCRRKATTTPARLVILSSLFLLLLTTHFPPTVRADDGSTPQVAALAAPNPAGGVAGSSIIDQFSPNCSAVTHIFQARGIDAMDIPQKPSNERVLRYCESPSVGTCCTYNMETRMAMQSRQQLEGHTKDQISRMSGILGSKAAKFKEIFIALLQESRTQFNKMFIRTYGVIYERNSYVFSDLFKELENYFANGRVDLLEVMDKFFNTLYQKMFTVLNTQYTFDENYMRCVSEHMKELKPFGDVPDKLSVQIKRSFVATRTYGQALTTASEVAKKVLNVRLNADCTGALTKMQHCGACKGYTEKPCTNYCVNVIKGCLHYQHEFDGEWENFAMAMDKVAERLLGSFNIVMVVEPLNIKISDAIMNFQDSGQDITNRVFQGCGRPKLKKMKRSISPKMQGVQVLNAKSPVEADTLDIDATLDEAMVLRERRAAEPGSQDSSGQQSQEQGVGKGGNGGGGGGGGGNNRRQQQRRKQQQQRRKQQNNRDDNDDDDNESGGGGREPILDKIVRDIRQRVKDYKKFWSNLPHSVCSNEDIASSSDVDGMCWNGHTIDRYMHSITTEHGSNPEFSGNPASTKQTAQMSAQLSHLKNAIVHLRNAYNGQDVEWTEQEELPYAGSGAGSGSGSEDDEDDDEGSGLGPFEPSHKPDVERPAVDVDNDDDEDAGGRAHLPTHTSRPTSGGDDKNPLIHTTHFDQDHNDLDEEHRQEEDDEDDGHGDSGGQPGDDNRSSDAPEKMTLRRALVVYLLPLYMAWFGGVCADLL